MSSLLVSIEDADISRRFSGLDRLYGTELAQAIRSTHIAIVGVGGVGSWAAEALARSGVGQLTLIDMDHVAESNINRQVQALGDTVGMAKIEAMRARIALINPQCVVNCVDAFAEPDNWPGILPHTVVAVIDACDQVKTKAAIANWARHHSRIFISAGAAGGKRQAHMVDIADLSEVTHDPLLAQVRYQLRKHHGAPKNGKTLGVQCVFSREAVEAADVSSAVPGDGTLNCHGYGSVVTVTASFGLSAAGWIMNKISQLEKKGALKTL